MPIFIIEHLEPRLWRWCIIEYKHISSIVGRNKLRITNLPRGSKVLSSYAKICRQSLKDLSLKKVCVLDPQASKTLSPSKAKSFDYFVFGGILGNHPPKKRTKQELTQFLSGAEMYNIGKTQMSTDNAVYVVKKIIEGTPLEQIDFVDGAEITLSRFSSTSFPFRYVLVNSKPLISKELILYLKRKDS